jgi:integrase
MSEKRIKKLNEDLKAKGALQVEKWLLTKDGIKRQYRDPSGPRRWQRLPIDLYRDLDEYSRKDLVSRLNHDNWRVKKAIENYEITSAFIPPRILEEFEKQLKKESNPQTARTRFQNLKKYCLEFFLPKSPSPIEWQKNYQDEWVDYLIGLDLAPSTYKHIKTSINKFMRFLAKKKPDLPIIKFDGVPPYLIKDVRAKRELRGLGQRHFINEVDYTKIIQSADDKLKPYIEIGYQYGLRRNEVLALELSNIRRDYLAVEAQIKKGQRTLPKYGKKRKVPHWFVEPRHLYHLVSTLKKYEPYELSQSFSKLTKELFQDGIVQHAYVFHDCRHSFCSRAVQKYSVHEVMLAAGHADLRVTSIYLKDTRSFGDDVFDPTGS